MKHPKFGAAVLNVYAGDSNPTRLSTFVRIVRITGRVNRGLWYECTDKNGGFWLTAPDSIRVVGEEDSK